MDLIKVVEELSFLGVEVNKEFTNNLTKYQYVWKDQNEFLDNYSKYMVDDNLTTPNDILHRMLEKHQVNQRTSRSSYKGQTTENQRKSQTVHILSKYLKENVTPIKNKLIKTEKMNDDLGDQWNEEILMNKIKKEKVKEEVEEINERIIEDDDEDILEDIFKESQDIKDNWNLINYDHKKLEEISFDQNLLFADYQAMGKIFEKKWKYFKNIFENCDKKIKILSSVDDIVNDRLDNYLVGQLLTVADGTGNLGLCRNDNIFQIYDETNETFDSIKLNFHNINLNGLLLHSGLFVMIKGGEISRNRFNVQKLFLPPINVRKKVEECSLSFCVSCGPFIANENDEENKWKYLEETFKRVQLFNKNVLILFGPFSDKSINMSSRDMNVTEECMKKIEEFSIKYLMKKVFIIPSLDDEEKLNALPADPFPYKSYSNIVQLPNPSYIILNGFNILLLSNSYVNETMNWQQDEESICSRNARKPELLFRNIIHQRHCYPFYPMHRTYVDYDSPTLEVECVPDMIIMPIKWHYLCERMEIVDELIGGREESWAMNPGRCHVMKNGELQGNVSWVQLKRWNNQEKMKVESKNEKIFLE
ncbi:hypothetical protein SNEBB_010756 [Seison nebaliae]|nr:hypothetical protein SNEBB_010756 [Seison nebaliae]